MQKASIITVCLNAVSAIEKAINTVRSQTCPNIEHIIIDGGSTDGTLDTIKKYIDGISHFISEPDRGLYDAMNKGIKVATGDVLFFLNSDDYFGDDRVVEDVLRVFNENRDIEIVFGNQIFDHGNKTKIKKQSFKVTREQLARMTIQHQTIFARRNLFEQTEGFSEEYKVVSDYDWILKVFLVYDCKYLYLDREISVMSTQGLSWTTDYEKERIRVMKRYFSDYEIFRYRVIPQRIRDISSFLKVLIARSKSA